MVVPVIITNKPTKVIDDRKDHKGEISHSNANKNSPLIIISWCKSRPIAETKRLSSPYLIAHCPDSNPSLRAWVQEVLLLQWHALKFINYRVAIRI